MTGPKILYWDIETSNTVLATWGLQEQYHSPETILKDWHIICAAWKWRDQSFVHSAKMGKTDEALVKKLHGVLSQADCIIAHNGDKFDLKKFNTRAIIYGLPPLPKIKTVDTLKIARKHFSFTSNKLDYIASCLKLPRKAAAPFKWWLDVLKGCRKAIANLEKYCKQDIVVLEQVHNKLEVYDDAAINLSLYYGADCCPRCGSDDWKHDGYRFTKTGKYQAYRCKDCDKSWQSGKSSRISRFR